MYLFVYLNFYSQNAVHKPCMRSYGHHLFRLKRISFLSTVYYLATQKIKVCDNLHTIPHENIMIGKNYLLRGEVYFNDLTNPILIP